MVITTRSVGVTTTGDPVRTNRPPAEWSGVPRVGSADRGRAAAVAERLREAGLAGQFTLADSTAAAVTALTSPG